MSLRTKLDGFRQIWHFDNRYQLILARSFFPGENLTTYRFKGLELDANRNTGDDVGVREVLATDTYRKHLRQMEVDGPINVLDIGANIGAFPILLLSEGLNIKRLACVELNPNTFSRMKANVEKNIEAHFSAINAALCGENKSFEIRLGRGGLCDNIYEKDVVNGTPCMVEGRTFDTISADAFGNEAIDLCKIDIEGAEFEVFRSGTFDRLATVRYLLMEIHHDVDRDRKEIVDRLTKMHFDEVGGDGKNDGGHYVHFFVNRHFGNVDRQIKINAKTEHGVVS